MNQRGLTLPELLAGLALAATLVALAVPGYRHQQIRNRQAEARAALLQNVQFLSHWQAETGHYKLDSRTWPELPVSGTAAFDIGFSTSARNTDDMRYLLQAKPKKDAAWLGEDYLEVDQDGNVKTCSPTGRSKRCSLRVL